jgi:hypothetical protein
MPTVTLPERCDRASAEALLPEFIAQLGAGPIEVDGRSVGQIGQAMLQLLVSARRSGEQVTIQPSPAMRDAAALTGLSQELFDEARP